MAYLDEREEMMLSYVEDTCLAREVQTDKLPLTPTIIVCGKLDFNWCVSFLCLDCEQYKMGECLLNVRVCFKRESVFERENILICICSCVSVSLPVPENVSGAQPFVSLMFCLVSFPFFFFFLGKSCFTATQFMLRLFRRTSPPLCHHWL